jgi:hypothetical protein
VRRLRPLGAGEFAARGWAISAWVRLDPRHNLLTAEILCSFNRFEICRSRVGASGFDSVCPDNMVAWQEEVDVCPPRAVWVADDGVSLTRSSCRHQHLGRIWNNACAIGSAHQDLAGATPQVVRGRHRAKRPALNPHGPSSAWRRDGPPSCGGADPDRSAAACVAG